MINNPFYENYEQIPNDSNPLQIDSFIPDSDQSQFQQVVIFFLMNTKQIQMYCNL